MQKYNYVGTIGSNNRMLSISNYLSLALCDYPIMIKKQAAEVNCPEMILALEASLESKLTILRLHYISRDLNRSLGKLYTKLVSKSYPVK